MSSNKKPSGITHKGAKRERELIASIVVWGTSGFNRQQARSFAMIFNETLNSPPLVEDNFAQAFNKAWSSVKEQRLLVTTGDIEDLQLEHELFGSLADVVETKPKWLWYPWLVKGAVNFIEGMPEKGKSFLTMKIAAELSRGGELPGERSLTPGNILVIDPEDDPSYTLRPRMRSMGADVDRIRYGKRDFALTVDENLAALKSQIKRYEIDLVIFDPLNSFLPGVDIHRDNQVRGVLGRLNEICQSTGCTMITVRHHTKAKTGDPMTRGLGSIGFTAYARSVVLVGEDPSDPNLSAIAHVKMNLAKKGRTLTFALSGGNGREGIMPEFVWCGESDATAFDIADGPKRDVGRPAEQSKGAEEFLLKELAGGPRIIKQLNSLAERRGIASDRTLRRVASEMGVKHTKLDGEKAWRLPKSKAA